MDFQLYQLLHTTGVWAFVSVLHEYIFYEPFLYSFNNEFCILILPCAPPLSDFLEDGLAIRYKLSTVSLTDHQVSAHPM